MSLLFKWKVSLAKRLYRWKARKKIRAYNRANPEVLNRTGKNLYASPVGKEGKHFLKKIIERFGYSDFDYLIFAYDDEPFAEEIFNGCRIIRERGPRWYFMKTYITPELCSRYGYIFIWADDIDIQEFSWRNFLAIMQRNRLQVAQPALTPCSYISHKVTKADPRRKVGRYADFVEIMIPVFTAEAWAEYWKYIDPEINPWGWGMDDLAHSLCGFANQGVIDCEPVTHTRPVSSSRASAIEGGKRFIKKHSEHQLALRTSLMNLQRP